MKLLPLSLPKLTRMCKHTHASLLLPGPQLTDSLLALRNGADTGPGTKDYILFICLFSVYLAHENIGYMEAKSLVCFVLWCISSVLNVPGMLAHISTLHTSSHALSGLPDMYYDLTSFCLCGLGKSI